MNANTTKLNITLPTNLLVKIDKANYNRNKLLVKLLSDYSNKLKK